MTQWNELPKYESSDAAPRSDWLIDPSPFGAGVFRGDRDGEIVLANELLLRRFTIQPNAATVDYENLMLGGSVIRGIKPEMTLALDGAPYAVGGLQGQEEYAYLRPEWIDSMASDESAFQFVSFETGPIRQRFAWKRRRPCADLPWPGGRYG